MKMRALIERDLENETVKAHSEWVKEGIPGRWNDTMNASIRVLHECGIRSRLDARLLANKYRR